jgi:hypothetical protein
MLLKAYYGKPYINQIRSHDWSSIPSYEMIFKRRAFLSYRLQRFFSETEGSSGVSRELQRSRNAFRSKTISVSVISPTV